MLMRVGLVMFMVQACYFQVTAPHSWMLQVAYWGMIAASILAVRLPR